MNYLVSILMLFTMIGCSSNTRETESENNVVSQTAADSVISNAKVYLGKGSYAEAVAIKDGKILFVGSEQAAQAYVANGTNVINASGQLVLPGFIDNHNHLGEGGEVTCTPSAEYTLSQQAQLLSQCAENVEAGKWIIGYGSDYLSEMDEQQTTPISVLNQLFPNNPVIIMDFTSHAQFVNSYALELAEIDKSTPDPIGGVYMKDSQGELNGVLLDNAGDLVMEMAVNSVEGKFDIFVEGILFGLQQARENGITSVGDGRTYWRRGMYEAWKQVESNNLLTARISLRPWIYPDVNKQEQLNFLQQAFQNDISKLLIVNQVKMYSDGIVPYGTGRVIEPYQFTWTPELPNGLNYISQAAMSDWLITLFGIGYGAHIHAIGDLGVRESLNSIEQVRNQGSALKYNMTHLEMVDQQDLNRFRQLNVDADLQLSAEAHSHAERVEHIAPFIGAQRANEVLLTPVKALQDSGANLVLSSDWTVNSISPLSAISIAVGEGALSIDEAISAYTINPASALGLDTITGSIEVGKSADLVVLERDITQLNSTEIKQVKVSKTLLEGEVVYTRN